MKRSRFWRAILSDAIDGVDEFRDWMQNLQDATIEDMNGTHFDIAGPVKNIEAMIAPPGGALAMYYTGPSEDFSRPGRTWYPTGGKTSFPLWREVSIAYHEGVPGHHFQIATTMTLSDQLSRYQRLLAGTSGYVEGWALYAERLMHELGYLENPDYYMGMLDAQALRSVRVIIDIGMHLRKADSGRFGIPSRRDLDPRTGVRVHARPSAFPARVRRQRNRSLPRHSGTGDFIQSRRTRLVRGSSPGTRSTGNLIRIERLAQPRVGARTDGIGADAARNVSDVMSF